MIVFLIVVSLGFVTVSGRVDRTTEDYATGEEVVEAVINRIGYSCVFEGEDLFLRRTAILASRDGTASNTFRPGFFGGVWQVKEEQFKMTKLGCQKILKTICDRIEADFGFTWKSVEWKDLLKPLYSGLATRLYTVLQLHMSKKNLSKLSFDQANIWAQNFNDGHLPATYKDMLYRVEQRCQGKEIDVAFILDSSGSVGITYFQKVLDFIGNILRGLQISPDTGRIGIVKYSFNANLEFDFGKFSDLAATLAGLKKIRYTGGGTNTDLAVGFTRTNVIRGRAPARRVAAKVVILVTDGYSYNFTATVMEAQRLKADGVNVFAVGIGFINELELEMLVTKPVCSHLQVLKSFMEIESVVDNIRKEICDAPLILHYPQPTDDDTIVFSSVQGEMSQLGTSKLLAVRILQLPPAESQLLVEVQVDCGSVDIYLSFATPVPSKEFYDFYGEATREQPSKIYIDLDQSQLGRRLFVNVVRGKSKQPCIQCASVKYNVTVHHGKEDDGSEIGDLCTKAAAERGTFYHCHPSKSDTFIQCDAHGRFRVKRCPGGLVFNPAVLVCDWPNRIYSTSSPLKPDV